MKSFRNILLASVLAMCATACIDDDVQSAYEEYEEMEYINLYIYTGEEMLSATRSLATNGENHIHNVKVWAFGDVEQGDGTTVRRRFGYVGKDFDHDPTGAEDLLFFYKTLRLAIPKIYLEEDGVTADFYFLANYSSIGQDALDETTTEEQLKSLSIAVNYFGGTTDNASQFSVAGGSISDSGNGLPISRVVTGVPVVDLLESMTPFRVVMERAVSRLRFFCAQDSRADELEVTGITIGTGTSDLLLSNEAVFSKEVAYTDELVAASSASVNAALAAWAAQSATEVKTANDETATYSKDKVTATINATTEIAKMYQLKTVYADVSDTDKPDWLEANATLVNITYLRETGVSTLPVSISYTIGGEEETTSFQVPLNEAGLLRNQEVNIFAYLPATGAELTLVIQTMPWEDSSLEVNYTETVSWADGGEPAWTPALDATNSGIETIGGNDYTVIYVSGGDTPSCSFALVTPEGWEWLAELVPLTDGALDYISFEDGGSVATGSVGLTSTLRFIISTASTDVTHRVRLKLYVRTTTGDQSREVRQFEYIISRSI